MSTETSVICVVLSLNEAHIINSTNRVLFHQPTDYISKVLKKKNTFTLKYKNVYSTYYSEIYVNFMQQ